MLLTSLDRLNLFMFVAAIYSRTKAFGEFRSTEWQKISTWAMKFQTAYENATEEEQKKMISVLKPLPGEDHNYFTMDNITNIIKKPIQSLLSPYVTQLAPLLFQMPFVIIETSDKIGFITSDNPCVWYDPAIYKKPRPFRAGGLVSPTVEITLPLSPNQLLFIGNGLTSAGSYLPIINNNLLLKFNLRTRVFAKSHLVSNSSEISLDTFFTNQPLQTN